MEERPPSSAREPDDDDALDLPALDGLSEGEDHEVSGADGAFDEAETEAEDEHIGLDASEGIDEPIELESGTTDEEETTRWTQGSEAADDVEAEADLVEGEEYGWTDDNEPAEELALDGDLDDAIQPVSTADDGGEEGPEEEADAALDAGPLPPMDADDEDEDDDEDEPFALDVLREVTGDSLPDEPERKPDA